MSTNKDDCFPIGHNPGNDTFKSTTMNTSNQGEGIPQEEINRIKKSAEIEARKWCASGIEDWLEGFKVGAADEYLRHHTASLSSGAGGRWVDAANGSPKKRTMVRWGLMASGEFSEQEMGDASLVSELVENGWLNVEWFEELPPTLSATQEEYVRPWRDGDELAGNDPLSWALSQVQVLQNTMIREIDRVTQLIANIRAKRDSQGKGYCVCDRKDQLIGPVHDKNLLPAPPVSNQK